MKSTNDLPTDPLGGLGPAIKPAAAPAPDKAKAFEAMSHDFLPPGLAEKPAAQPVVHIDDEGCDLREPNVCHCGADKQALCGVLMCVRLDCRE